MLVCEGLDEHQMFEHMFFNGLISLKITFKTYTAGEAQNDYIYI